MGRKIGSFLILVGVLCLLAAFCMDADRAPDWMLSSPALQTVEKGAFGLDDRVAGKE